MAAIVPARAVHDPQMNNDQNPNNYFEKFPPGYRFCPTDEESIEYLKKKANKQPLPPTKIHDVSLYNHPPDYLAERYEGVGENEWYFFTSRDKKYKNGFRPKRRAGDGYWKATGVDKIIKSNNAKIGTRKTLIFLRGNPPHGVKTNWIMYEFKLIDPPPVNKEDDQDDMKLDDWVLCKIYKKIDKSRGRDSTNQGERNTIHHGENRQNQQQHNFHQPRETSDQQYELSEFSQHHNLQNQLLSELQDFQHQLPLQDFELQNIPCELPPEASQTQTSYQYYNFQHELPETSHPRNFRHQFPPEPSSFNNIGNIYGGYYLQQQQQIFSNGLDEVSLNSVNDTENLCGGGYLQQQSFHNGIHDKVPFNTYAHEPYLQPFPNEFYEAPTSNNYQIQDLNMNMNYLLQRNGLDDPVHDTNLSATHPSQSAAHLSPSAAYCFSKSPEYL